MSRETDRPLKRIWGQYAAAAAADIVGLALAAIVPAIAARRWGTRGFAEYAILYRALAFLQPPLLLGLGVALPRFIARRRGTAGTPDNSSSSSDELLASALAAVFLCLALSSAILLSASKTASELLFDDVQHRNLIVVLVVMLVGSCSWALVSGYLRGRFLLGRANLLMVWYVGLTPVAAILIRHSVEQVMLLIGMLWIAGAFVAARVSGWRFTGTKGLVTSARDLLRFGVRRVPGELSLFGLFALPPIFAARQESLVEAGFLAFAISVVTFAGSLFNPISLVLLPVASEMLGTSGRDEIRAHLSRLIPAVAVLSIAGMAVIQMGASVGARAYLGSGFEGVVGILRLIAISVPPYVVFVSLRGLLDAQHYRAVSLRNASYAFVTFLLSTLVLSMSGVSRSAAISFVASVWLLGIATVRDALRTLSFSGLEER